MDLIAARPFFSPVVKEAWLSLSFPERIDAALQMLFSQKAKPKWWPNQATDHYIEIKLLTTEKDKHTLYCLSWSCLKLKGAYLSVMFGLLCGRGATDWSPSNTLLHLSHFKSGVEPVLGASALTGAKQAQCVEHPDCWFVHKWLFLFFASSLIKDGKNIKKWNDE